MANGHCLQHWPGPKISESRGARPGYARSSGNPTRVNHRVVLETWSATLRTLRGRARRCANCAAAAVR
eukprot:8943081-Lingulodinium_polyedra.AAC.1